MSKFIVVTEAPLRYSENWDVPHLPEDTDIAIRADDILTFSRHASVPVTLLRTREQLYVVNETVEDLLHQLGDAVAARSLATRRRMRSLPDIHTTLNAVTELFDAAGNGGNGGDVAPLTGGDGYSPPPGMYVIGEPRDAMTAMPPTDTQIIPPDNSLASTIGRWLRGGGQRTPTTPQAAEAPANTSRERRVDIE